MAADKRPVCRRDQSPRLVPSLVCQACRVSRKWKSSAGQRHVLHHCGAGGPSQDLTGLDETRQVLIIWDSQGFQGSGSSYLCRQRTSDHAGADLFRDAGSAPAAWRGNGVRLGRSPAGPQPVSRCDGQRTCVAPDLHNPSPGLHQTWFHSTGGAGSVSRSVEAL